MPPHAPTIRPVAPSDVFSLAKVYEETARAAYQGIIPHDNLEAMIARRTPGWWRRTLGKGSQTLVLEVDGRIAGYVTFGPSRYGEGEAGSAAPSGEIYEIQVLPTHQGLGFGARLFEAARSALAEEGHEDVMAWAIADNEQAVAFFAHMGGQVFAETRILYRTKTLRRVAFAFRPGVERPVRRA